jgi:outer membrane protein assembly factor BamB
MSRRFPIAAAIIGIFTAATLAADWTQWRGPERNGQSKETGLFKEWPKDGPKLHWQLKDIGEGYATPSVAGDRLYILVNKGQEDELVQARKVSNGDVVWSKRIGKVGPNGIPPYPGARSTPTIEGDVLFALGSDGDLVCLNISDGSEVWHKSLRTDFEGMPGKWAYSESPLVDGDKVVCTPGGKEATIVAVNKKNGDVVWKCAVPDGDQAAYASPIATEIGGVKQYVQFLAKGVVGVDAKSGKFLWRYDQTAKGSPANIPTPVAHDGYVYTGTGLGGAGLVKIKGEKNDFTTDQVYFEKGLPNCIGGTVLLGDYLYGTTTKGLTCMEFATGKKKWQDETIGAASLCFADGNLYVHGEDGNVRLVEATPEGFREKGKVTPPDQPKHTRGAMEKSWAYPVVANGKLYIRDHACLWCYDVKSEK